MSKETKSTEVKELKTYNKKQVFFAMLPWAIIVLVSVAFIGLVVGWTLRSNDQCRIESQASQLVEKLKSQK